MNNCFADTLETLEYPEEYTRKEGICIKVLTIIPLQSFNRCRIITRHPLTKKFFTELDEFLSSKGVIDSLIYNENGAVKGDFEDVVGEHDFILSTQATQVYVQHLAKSFSPDDFIGHVINTTTAEINIVIMPLP